MQRRGLCVRGAASPQVICVKNNGVYLAVRIVLFSPGGPFDGVNPQIEGFHLDCRATVGESRKPALEDGKYSAIRTFRVRFPKPH